MSLTTPAGVQKPQTALRVKAKESPNFRFYALYDKVYRKDVLTFAYQCSKANGGTAGVDDQTFEDIEAYRPGAMAGRTGARAEEPNLSTTSCPAGVHPKARRETASVRGARYP